MASPLEENFHYYVENEKALVSKYNGRFIVIRNRAVIGDYAQEVEAIRKTAQVHPIGTFLVQKVEPGAGKATQVFHSRVHFKERA